MKKGEVYLSFVFQGITSLVSSLGGALSLYLGISVAMLFEVLEFGIDILIGLLSFNNKRK